ncbi:MAG TPA: hypothetical protein VIM16_07125 [Mucilaginibacter sp.]|jgi:hypothetical protein
MRKNILFPAIAVLLLTILFPCKKELAVKNSVSLNASNVTAPKDANFVPFAVAAKAAQQVNGSHLVSGIVAKKLFSQLLVYQANKYWIRLQCPIM